MGASLQWREPNDRRAAVARRTIRFGGRRDGGTGYFVASQRAGPSVLVLGDDDRQGAALADALGIEGFTVLAVGEHQPQVVAAAADHLVQNWHPRLGLVCIAVEPPVDVAVDALVLVGLPTPGDNPAPLLSIDRLWSPSGDLVPAALEEIEDWLHRHCA